MAKCIICLGLAVCGMLLIGDLKLVCGIFLLMWANNVSREYDHVERKHKIEGACIEDLK